MNWLFGSPQKPQDVLRKNQRALNRAMRDINREKARMEQQEKKLIVDIKKMAKDGQMDAVKIMAKDLVTTRRTIKKFMLMHANMQGVSLKIHTLKSQDTMSRAMIGVSKTMASMNKSMNIPQVQRIMMDFERQSEMMNMKEELINDTIDDALEVDADEEESDAIVNQVLDELGLKVGEDLGAVNVPTGGLTVTKVVDAKKSPTAVGVGPSSDPPVDPGDDLQARLDHLKRK